MKSVQATTNKNKTKALGIPRFDGNEENEYSTRHILTGLRHLVKLNADDATKAKIDEIPKTESRFLIESF
jgi:hypothetical protein